MCVCVNIRQLPAAALGTAVHVPSFHDSPVQHYTCARKDLLVLVLQSQIVNVGPDPLPMYVRGQRCQVQQQQVINQRQHRVASPVACECR